MSYPDSPDHPDQPAGAAVTRRTVLAGLGAAAAGIAFGAATDTAPRAAADGRLAGTMPYRPNIVLFITDQERKPMHWPAGWAERNLPNRKRLIDHGLSFENAFCASAMCSPSRSTFFTGKYPAEHGVTSTLTEGGTVSPTEPTLRVDEQNMAKILAAAGYRVEYRGKWHLSKGTDGGSPTAADLAKYGFGGWTGPDFGGDTKPSNFGGGCADHDGRVTAQAVDFLRTDARDGRPFALIVSLANPHDILSFPKSWDSHVGDCDNYASKAPKAFRQGIDLPASFREKLLLNHKPTAQAQSQLLLAGALGVLPTERDARNYVNFYAYLHKVVDAHLGEVLDAIEEDAQLHRNTVVVKISDHGEMGLSHGGLRQKTFNAYEETLRVPLIVSNPTMFPRGATTTALASLVDLMPTFATLADVPDRSQFTFRGADLTPIIRDAVARPDRPTAAVQDSVLFTFDDVNTAAPDGQRIVTAPNRIRAVRDDRWKYTVYFDPTGVMPSQRELYDLRADPFELHNLANPLAPGYRPQKVAQMQRTLDRRMRRTRTSFR